MSNKSPLVSVIIPVYKVEKYLHQCVDSILRQTYRNLEVILVDDASPDRCGLICDEYKRKDNRVIVIHRPNGGLSVARNTGLEIARGEYIYFLDSDDWISEVAIETLVAKAEAGSYDVVLFDAKAVSEDGGDIQGFKYHRETEYPDATGPEMFRQLRSNNEYYAIVYLMLIKHELLLKENIIFIPGIIHEDEPFTFDLLMNAEKTAHVKKIMHFRRRRNDSIVGMPRTVKNVEGIYTAAKEAASYYSAIKTGPFGQVVFEHIWVLFTSAMKHYSDITDSSKQQALRLLYKLSDLLVFSDGADYDNCRRLIYYGGGWRCKKMIDELNVIPDEIWDLNAEAIESINGIHVREPDWPLLRDKPDWLLVVCVDDYQAWKNVLKICSDNNYKNICHWRGHLFFQSLKEL